LAIVNSNRVVIRACAKINLELRVLGPRPDGFHDVRTTLQSIALHDILTFTRTRGPFTIECDDPGVPAAGNIVGRAAAGLWKAAGRKGRLADVHVKIDKRIPVAAGLGGGSANAAAALRALTALWGARVDPVRLRALAATLGADVPYFLEGGTALGVERGDVVYPLADAAPRWVVLVIPPFGVSTPDAYRWWDEAARPLQGRRMVRRPVQGPSVRSGVNDLQPPVAGRHPEIGRIARALQRAGAVAATMSGSGSAVFGLFVTRAAAEAAAGALAASKRRAIVTRTLSRSVYARFTLPRLARK
jgi:4-diphosphocytidyl-2-C-methyl-D-erythritol kinase